MRRPATRSPSSNQAHLALRRPRQQHLRNLARLRRRHRERPRRPHPPHLLLRCSSSRRWRMISPPCGKVSSSSPPARSRWLATSPSCRLPGNRPPGMTSGAGYRRFRRPPPPPLASPSRCRNSLLSHQRRHSRPSRLNLLLSQRWRSRSRPRAPDRHDHQCRCAERHIGSFRENPRGMIAIARACGQRPSLAVVKLVHGNEKTRER